MVKIYPSKKVIISGGGGGSPPTIAWGPDFGEALGADNNTFKVGINLSLDKIALEYTKTIGVQLTQPIVELNHTKTLGVHMSGTALGAPNWKSEAHIADNLGGPTTVVNKPSGTVEGDLMLAFIGGFIDSGSLTLSPPAGWSGILTTLISTGTTRLRGVSFKKIATASEPTSYTFTWTGTAADTATGEIHRIDAVSVTNPDSSVAGTVLTADLNANPDSPSVSTTVANCLVFAWLLHNHSGLNQTHIAPENHIERTDFEAVNDLNIISSTTCTRVFNNTGATGVATHDCTETVGTDGIMHRIAIGPGTIILAT